MANRVRYCTVSVFMVLAGYSIPVPPLQKGEDNLWFATKSYFDPLSSSQDEFAPSNSIRSCLVRRFFWSFRHLALTASQWLQFATKRPNCVATVG
ncbi:hypothetical protein B0T24DRAFT_248687 [Lasiosphaeria ovina]|uniref:Uncharacterized protein n=1 Tax=Lasiosphaeria ovina TaxID=92902 RepID=A0AAE0KBJ3_9PEZI|nr:hypothetical protein B0T24DRAFT_248687 [Lasiosphaeria ovina]